MSMFETWSLTLESVEVDLARSESFSGESVTLEV
jgi:hypothetical protein